MARSLCKTLILTSHSSLFSSHNSRSASRLATLRPQSTRSETADHRDALAVQNIEDAIHGIIVRRSAPDWLPFVPGSSYWVPPRTGSYGIADLVDKLANSLTDEEVMSLATARGWPSSAFFGVNETSHPEDEN